MQSYSKTHSSIDLEAESFLNLYVENFPRGLPWDALGPMQALPACARPLEVCTVPFHGRISWKLGVKVLEALNFINSEEELAS